MGDGGNLLYWFSTVVTHHPSLRTEGVAISFPSPDCFVAKLLAMTLLKVEDTLILYSVTYLFELDHTLL